MKRALYTMALGLAVFAATSCTKIDNYEAPTETLTGRIIDGGTGQNLQSEVSGDNGNGTRIRLVETSWSATATPLYLATKQDGTYNNTKVFAATYKMVAEGAFVPMDLAGNDKTQTVEVKGGTTTVDFTVDPFLRVEWVGEPVVNPNGTITAQFKVNRGTTNAAYQQNITDITMFLCPFQYVGNNNYELKYSPKITYSGSAGNGDLGKTLTLTTPVAAPLTKQTWYLRVGARIAFGTNRYNYTTIKAINVQY